MLRVIVRRCLAGSVLIAASALMVSAQETLTPEKHAAIRKLIEVSGMQRYMSATFVETITRKQEGWPDAVIADFKAKGLFKSLTPEDVAKMEKLVYEFSDNVFGGIKRRVSQDVITTENLDSASAPIYDKYFTEDEINEMAAFCQTRYGKKFLDEYSKVLTEAIVSTLEAKGAFTTLPSSEAEAANANRLRKEVENNPAAVVQQVFEATKIISPDHFTEAEVRELVAFSKTPLGKKLAEIAPRFIIEVMGSNSKVIGPQLGKLFSEVFREQMQVFNARAHEILKKYDSKGRGN